MNLYTGPELSLAAIILYAKRRQLDPDIVDTLPWYSKLKDSIREVVFEDQDA